MAASGPGGIVAGGIVTESGRIFRTSTCTLGGCGTWAPEHTSSVVAVCRHVERRFPARDRTRAPLHRKVDSLLLGHQVNSPESILSYLIFLNQTHIQVQHSEGT